MGRIVTIVVAGGGWFSLSVEEATAFAVRVRELTPEDDPDAQAAAFTFESAVAAGTDTVVVARTMLPLFREALALLIDAGAGGEQLLALRQALEEE